jgi:hypothetical protein
MMAETPKLIDAEERARRFPRTWVIPSRLDRESLRVGQLAKLCFDDQERLWVRVIERMAPRYHYRGALASVSIVFPQLPLGHAVTFGPEHVCDIAEDVSENG